MGLAYMAYMERLDTMLFRISRYTVRRVSAIRRLVSGGSPASSPTDVVPGGLRSILGQHDMFQHHFNLFGEHVDRSPARFNRSAPLFTGGLPKALCERSGRRRTGTDEVD